MIKEDLKTIEDLKERYRAARASPKDSLACKKIGSLLSSAQYHMGRLTTFKEDVDAEASEEETVAEEHGEDSQQDGTDVSEGAAQPEDQSDVAPSINSDASTESADAGGSPSQVSD